MDALQAGVKPTPAVFLQVSVLLQPREAVFNNPALGHDFESMQFTAFSNLGETSPPVYFSILQSIQYLIFLKEVFKNISDYVYCIYNFTANFQKTNTNPASTPFLSK